MSKKSDQKKNEILDAIDDATAPNKMGQEEALEFLEELQADLEGRIDGIKEDMENNE